MESYWEKAFLFSNIDEFNFNEESNLKKILALVLAYGLSDTALASGYVGETGTVSELRYASYYGGKSCIKVNDTWFFFNNSETGDDFLKSMVLAASASRKKIHAGSNSNNVSNDFCSGITAYNLLVLQYKE